MASETHEAPLSPARRAFPRENQHRGIRDSRALVGIPVVGFLLGPLLQSTTEIWRSVGKIDSFQIGTTVRVTFVDPSPLAMGRT